MVNLTARFQTILNTLPNQNILGYKKNNIWNWITRNQLKNKILYCVDVLKSNNISLNDRVVYKGDNNVNWVAWDIATNAIGGIFVPLYGNQKQKVVDFIVEDCEPKLFIGNNNCNKNTKENIKCFQDTIEDFEYNTSIPIEYNSDIAKLIYTSGTTGAPKGVMLSHENILSNVSAIERTFSDLQIKDQLTTLNILPWAHIYGLTTELYYNLLNNNKIAISSGPLQFVKEIREIQPDLLYLVPRVLQMIKNKISFLDKPLIELVLPKILNFIFGKNLITIFVGGAKLDETTKQFYKKFNIPICEGYGTTETSPMISVNHMTSPRNDESIGKVLDNLIVKIIDNEICVSGPSVMKGYYNNNRANAEVFLYNDGIKFYRTGDSGYINDDFLFFEGRIRENYKLSNGKFVNVEFVENKIKKFLGDVFMIFGDNQEYNILIIQKPTIIDKSLLKKINDELDGYLQIKKILTLDEDALTNCMTPKMSLKRKDIVQKFQDKIDEIYH